MAPQALKRAFTALMSAEPAAVTEAVRSLVSRLASRAREQLSEHEALALRLNTQFPDDVGIFSAFFLNIVRIKPSWSAPRCDACPPGCGALRRVSLWPPCAGPAAGWLRHPPASQRAARLPVGRAGGGHGGLGQRHPRWANAQVQARRSAVRVAHVPAR